MIQPDTNGLYHPASEEEICNLIQFAIQNKKQVRVRGAAQSVSSGIFTDDFGISNDESGINMMLDQMRSVTFTEGSNLVTVQAGCNLGFDPFDPSHTSTATDGLFYQLQMHGLAIPNVADEIQQTVAGFISTGSSAGSVAHSFLEALVSIRVVDGTGKVQVFEKPEDANSNNAFYAVGVSLGLLGVITEVTLQCIPSFHVIGQQAITPDTEAAFDFFDTGTDGKPSLQTFLSSTEFTRLIWWPFPTVKRLIAWQARTMQPSDYNTQTGSPTDFHAKPYQDAFSGLDKYGIPAELLASSLYAVIGNWPNVLQDLFGNQIDVNGKSIDTTIIQKVIDVLWPFLLPHLVNLFVPCDNGKPPQTFWDSWINALPNDTHEYSNNLLTAYRTEFWIPLEQARQAMSVLNNYYEHQYFPNSDTENKNTANGCYVVEVLGAKSTSFWLSPSYNQDCLRINFYSLKETQDDVMNYFQQFWDLFYNNKINIRLHWGYLLPPPSGSEGAKYLTNQYPMWPQFLNLRESMDPHNLFVNTYWKEQLNIF